MVHFLKDLESYSYNREKIVKLIPIDDLASHFLFLTKVDDHTFEARYESFAPIGSRDNVILIDIESQTFAHQGKVGDAVDLFKLLCEKGDFFTFIKKNYGINIKQYIQYIKFNDGTMIEIKEYPIKDMKQYIKDWE